MGVAEKRRRVGDGPVDVSRDIAHTPIHLVGAHRSASQSRRRGPFFVAKSPTLALAGKGAHLKLDGPLSTITPVMWLRWNLMGALLFLSAVRGNLPTRRTLLPRNLTISKDSLRAALSPALTRAPDTPQNSADR